MRWQRGIADGWLLLAGVLVLCGLGLAALFGVKSWEHGIDQRGYTRGVNETSARYEARDKSALLAMTKERDALQAMLDAQRKASETKIRQMADEYRKGKEAREAQYQRDLAAVRDGSLKLRDPGQTARAGTGCSETAGGENQPAGSGPGAAGAGDGQLSAEASGFLLWLASEADRLAEKVNKLVGVAKADREQINGARASDVRPRLRVETEVLARQQ